MTSRANQPDTPTDEDIRNCLIATPPQCFAMVAGAGSGKTTSLIKALQVIIAAHGNKMRKRRQKVACITYTKIAAGEIWNDVGNNPLVHVSTIHSFFWLLIRPLQTDIRTWVAGRIEEKLADLRGKAANFSPRVQQRTRDKNAQDIARFESQQGRMSAVKSFTYGTGSDYSNGILGHADVIQMVCELLQQRPLLRTLLAQQFPFVFVDESQDTAPVVVEALRAVEAQMRGSFCLGFFGDPMQQIYPTGVGKIDLDPEWKPITKPENFRCPATILGVANQIRRDGDGLEQTRGRMKKNANGDLEPVQGSARVFVLPADGRRVERLGQVRRWVADANQDNGWLPAQVDTNVKVLVIVHRMVAKRLGFATLYASMNDGAPTSFKEGFLDGSAWPLRPFMLFVLPIVEAAMNGRDFEVIELLRKNCPLLEKASLQDVNVAARLAELQANIDALVALQAPGSHASVRDVLAHLRISRLLGLDERVSSYLDLDVGDEALAGEDIENEDESSAREIASMDAFLGCEARELWGFRTYVNEESPYSTQQGIKGAEYERVLTVLDDDEGTHSQFSYDKYFGIIPLNARDQANLGAGRETPVERTRRLFYVSCTRALQDLVVVFFAGDVGLAAARIRAAGIFPNDEIWLEDALPLLDATN